MKKLEEGIPIEHSDKWGKPSIPYSVSLSYKFQAGRTIEFWFNGSLKVEEHSFLVQNFTHFAVVEHKILLNFEVTDITTTTDQLNI